MLVNTRSHLINVVATPLWGVCTFGAARSGQRTAPWLQRVRIYETASRLRALVRRVGSNLHYERLYWNI